MLWEFILEVDDEASLTNFANVQDWLSVCGADSLGGAVYYAVSESASARHVWRDNVHCLRVVAAELHGAATRRGDMGAGEARSRYHWHLRRCLPPPIELPSGRIAMPNDFHITDARPAPPTRREWVDLGVTEDFYSEAVRAVRDWWIPVFASLAIGEPVCARCEAALPPTASGRRSRRAVCRACENAEYYKRLRQRDPEYLRAAWRESKRRIRKGA